MIDPTYRDALDAALANDYRHPQVILGPAPCQRCGAWVEWAGVMWLELATAEAHECAPYLVQREATDADMAVPMIGYTQRPPDSFTVAAALIAAGAAIFLLCYWVGQVIRAAHGG